MLNCDNIVQNNTATQQTSFWKGNCAGDFFLSQKVVAVNPCRPVSRHHISITVCCTLRFAGMDLTLNQLLSPASLRWSYKSTSSTQRDTCDPLKGSLSSLR